MALNLHKVLYLYKTPTKFYLQPIEEPDEALIIDRQTCEISSNTAFSVGQLPAKATSCLIYGVIGIKHLVTNTYLIVITKATDIGLIDGQIIYRMDEAEVIPFNQHTVPLNESQNDWNKTYLSMLESALKTPSYYFSYSYDLTNSLQNNQVKDRQKYQSNYSNSCQYYDKRFLWNSHVMNDFERYDNITGRFRLPFILGFISINQIILGRRISWTLVSRRSIFRAGTRFNCRGVDYEGNVANFVETEQIVEEPGVFQTSYVQVRGSIPLFWSQKPDYRYKPAIEIDRDHDHDLAMNKHFNELRVHYGHNIAVVNLIDNSGHEGQLEHQFSERIKKIDSIQYFYFDFHKECSKMRWHRLSILLDRIAPAGKTIGYYCKSGNTISMLQEGVIRSNCIDSLDRTNVVQSMIAQHIFGEQFHQSGAEQYVPFDGSATNRRTNSKSEYEYFMEIFKNAWADNADVLSVQYAGTPALKTDFTRTGKRTHQGLVKDGINSLTRYVSNNFLDQYRQDSIHLLLGNYEGYPSPLYRPLNLVSYSSAIPVTIIMLTLIALYIYLEI